jgi:hypothetical protein
MRKYLYDFSHAIRYTAGLVSYDELRSYIAFKLRNSLAMVPNEERIPLFLKDLFGVGLVGEAAYSRLKIFTSIYKFDHFFNEYIKTQKKLLIFDKDAVKGLVSSSPMFISYINKIQKSCHLIDDFLAKPTNVDLQDVLMKVQYEDFDKIRLMHRDKTRYVDVISKLWTRSFTILYSKDSFERLTDYRKQVKTLLTSCKLYPLERGFNSELAKGGLMLHQ